MTNENTVCDKMGRPSDGSNAMNVSLTFDNGPDFDSTPRVLDALRERGIAATFFLVGKQLRDARNAALVERIRADGHAIGNHTTTHRRLGELDATAALAEIDDTQALIDGDDRYGRLFRPPGGGGIIDEFTMSRAAYEHLRSNGYTCVLWNNLPRDWENADGWSALALDRLGALDWSVLVLHDPYAKAMRALPQFLDRALDAGARFTLDFPNDCTPLRRGAEIWAMPMSER
jgi:peptidoglycan-N-acetylglucosamine deacetylase